jgi:hypothetical protein
MHTVKEFLEFKPSACWVACESTKNRAGRRTEEYNLSHKGRFVPLADW